MPVNAGVISPVVEQHLPHAAPGMNFSAPLLQIVDDGLMQVGIGRTLQHPQHRRLGTGRKQLEYGQHAAGRNIFGVDKAQGIGNGVPHALEAAPGCRRVCETSRQS